MYDQRSCITDLTSLSKNSETFSVLVPQFEINGLSGISDIRLWILGNQYSLPKLVAFLRSILILLLLGFFGVRILGGRGHKVLPSITQGRNMET